MSGILLLGSKLFRRTDRRDQSNTIEINLKLKVIVVADRHLLNNKFSHETVNIFKQLIHKCIYVLIIRPKIAFLKT